MKNDFLWEYLLWRYSVRTIVNMWKYLGQCQLPGEGSVRVFLSSVHWWYFCPVVHRVESMTQRTSLECSCAGPCPTFTWNGGPAYHPLAVLEVSAQIPFHSTPEPLSPMPSLSPSLLTELCVSQTLQGHTWEFVVSQACSSFITTWPPSPLSHALICHTALLDCQYVDSYSPTVTRSFWDSLLP